MISRRNGLRVAGYSSLAAGALQYAPDAVNLARAVIQRAAKYNPPSPPGSPKRKVASYREYIRNKPAKIARMSRPGGRSRGGSGGGGRGGGSTRKRRYKKKRRAYKKKRYIGRIKPNEGVSVRTEAIQKVRDLQAVYIGHVTFPANQIEFMVARSIVKAFWAKEGIIVENGLSLGPTSETVYRIYYYASPTALTLTVGSTASIDPSATFDEHVLQFRILQKALMTTSDNLYKWQRIKFSGTNFQHECNMVTSMLTGNCHSTIAFQNATANALGETGTDVNNANPVTITRYHGNGSGTEMIVRGAAIAGPPTYTSFIGDVNDGHISVVADSVANNQLDEPPPAKLFHHCKAGGRFVLGPGNIHKSHLYTNYRFSISTYMNIMMGHPPTTKQLVRKGVYEFFAGEKVVTTTVAGNASNVPVELDYEIDHKIRFKCSFKSVQMSLPFINNQSVLPDKGFFA